MIFISFLTKKYFSSIFSNKSLRLPILISIISIGISIFSLMVVMFVMKGFEVKVQNKILSNFPHIMITNKLKKDLNGISNIDSFQESIEGYGAYINKSGFEIIKIKGLAGDRIKFKKQENTSYNFAYISKDFSYTTGIDNNETFEIFVPAPNTLKKIKKIQIKVLGELEIEQNVPTIFLDFDKAEKLILSKSLIEVKLFDPFKSKETMSEIITKNNNLKGQIIDWQTINSNLFNIMKLERISLGVFLSFLILISCTTIYSNTNTMIFQRKEEIATLLILGAKKKDILIVFVLTNFFISLIGYLVGSLIAYASTKILDNKNLIDTLGVNLSFYGIDGFPIIFSTYYFNMISVFSFILIILATFLPTTFYLRKNIDDLIVRVG
jgi:ABC-type lipoprotein release transport system permease subunit|tara:strand:+ start:40112 stop:41254 length:1143 start_codon:yes stop_codon:yes gene_type:complete